MAVHDEVALVALIAGTDVDRIGTRVHHTLGTCAQMLDHDGVLPHPFQTAELGIDGGFGIVRRIEATHVTPLRVDDRHDLERIDVDVIGVGSTF